MKKQIILIIGIVLISTFAHAQRAKLNVENDKITIPINTELKISVALDDGKLHDFKLVEKSKIKKPIDMMSTFEDIEKPDIISNEIEMQFCEADFMGSKYIVLTTIQHLEQSIIFKAKIKIAGRKKYIETSIVPCHPNVLTTEQWQDKIESIILYDFEIHN